MYGLHYTIESFGFADPSCFGMVFCSAIHSLSTNMMAGEVYLLMRIESSGSQMIVTTYDINLESKMVILYIWTMCSVSLTCAVL
jgi:hypothetical protein